MEKQESKSKAERELECVLEEFFNERDDENDDYSLSDFITDGGEA